jgi:CDP-diacylglycerol--glycerol-3-phosphate 3-phosphatidyltransferase
LVVAVAALICTLALAQLSRVFSRLSAIMLSLPNLLTMSRVPLMFAVVGLMYADFDWAAVIAFWLFIVAALTDWLDGAIARARGEVSLFGRFMDAVIDKVLVLGLLIALVNNPNNFLGYDVMAMLVLLCILCREFAVQGLRMAMALKGQVVEADASGKLKTFLQLNAIGWLMGSRMLAAEHGGGFGGDDRGWVIGVRIIGIVLYVASAVLTITSGFSYFRRYGKVLFK